MLTHPLPSLGELRKTPSRIVCIAPSNTELLYALGAEDRIVGVSRYCDFPAAAGAKPRCGGFLDPHINKILALKPDLVLAQSFLQEDAVKALVHAEVRVLAFSATSLKEVLEDVLLLGRLVERERKRSSLSKGFMSSFRVWRARESNCRLVAAASRASTSKNGARMNRTTWPATGRPRC